MTFEIRLKEQTEREFDKDDVAQRQLEMNVACKDFVTEFIDCEGEVYYSTAMKAMNYVFQYDQAVKFAGCSKVGPEWDHEAGIVGMWRYPHLRKDND